MSDESGEPRAHEAERQELDSLEPGFDADEFFDEDEDPRFNEAISEVRPSVSFRTPAFRVKPFQKDHHDATTRRWLAFVVLGVVSVLYGMAVIGLIANALSLTEFGRVALVLGPIQALAAAVLGFYFGQEKG